MTEYRWRINPWWIVCVVVLLLSVNGVTRTRSELLDWQTAAVEHGAAYWHVEPDGKTEFRWKGDGEDD